MSFYEELVMRTQMNYSKYYSIYAAGKTPYILTDKASLPYGEQIELLTEWIKDADGILVGGASGLSAAGGGDFYYDDTPSYRRYFGKYAEKYGFKGAFAGMAHTFDTREEFWGYLATFLYTTQHAPIYPEEIVSEIKGDHRFFQCSRSCCDDTWDAVKPVEEMIQAMGEKTFVPTERIPRCPHCGAEAFPWVRGYGNFLQGRKYEEQYQKVSDFLRENMDKKILFLELGVGRLTPMFIQEPFWNLTANLPRAKYVAVNQEYDFLPKEIEDKGMVICNDIARVLRDAAKILGSSAGKEQKNG